MYLAYFEQIVAATVVQLGGPPDWALPYWDYSDTNNPDALNIPPAFTDGTPNTNPLQMPPASDGTPGRENTTVNADDVRRVAPLALAHRRRRSPFDQPGIDQQEIDQALDRPSAGTGPGSDDSTGSDGGTESEAAHTRAGRFSQPCLHNADRRRHVALAGRAEQYR